MDLRSGKQKSSLVPPPRPYRRRPAPEMVVHSPDAFEAKRAAAAAASAAARAADTEDRARAADAGDRAAGEAGQTAHTVPPSVLAAAAGASAGSVAAGSQVTPAEEADLLGDEDAITHDFTAWQGEQPPRTRADVHVQEEREEDIQFGHGRRHHRADTLTLRADEDKISVAGSIQGNLGNHAVPPPTPDQLNPFTPEWFSQIIGAAASAAATAAATAAVAGAARLPAAGTAPVPNLSAPRRLNDRKVPDFWEDRPEFWFQIFDAHLNHFRPSERQCFDALLPLLTPAARSTVHSVIRTPGNTPYTKAREALLRHFGRTPRQLAREARESRSMGDKLPSEYLDYIMGLLPDVKTFYEIALLDALSPNARVAALQHSGVEAMARAADAVVLESRAEAELSRSVSAISLFEDSSDSPSGPPPITPSVAAVSRPPRKSDTLCGQHARWGKKAYKCQAPSTCRMSKIISPKPASTTSATAPGNGKAGGQ